MKRKNNLWAYVVGFIIAVPLFYGIKKFVNTPSPSSNTNSSATNQNDTSPKANAPTQKPQKIMPKIVGMNIDKAEESLTEIGFKTEIEEVYDESSSGTVLSSEFEEGTDLSKKYTNTVKVVVSKGSIQNLLDSAEEATYDNLIRYPDTYKSKAIKVDAEITKYDTSKILGVTYDEFYWALCEGETVILYDNRTAKEPALLVGDKITMYGYGNGTSTIDVKQKEYLGSLVLGLSYNKTVDSYLVPCLKFDYVEINN